MSRDWLLYLDDLIDSAEKVQRFLKDRSLDAGRPARIDVKSTKM